MIQILDAAGNSIDDALAVRYGVTPDDWEAASNDKTFVELIDGMLIMHSPVSLTHARVFDFLYRLLGGFVEQRALGEVFAGPFTMELSLERKFEPDLMYLAERTRANLTEDRLEGPADFAIEIASPSTRGYDRGVKRDCYRVGGVREYWMVDPYDRKVIVDRPAGKQVAAVSTGRVECPHCPGFWIEAAWLWDTDAKVQDCFNIILAASG